MVFVLAVLGCGVFTTYASGLFFRQKSRQLGVFFGPGRHAPATEPDAYEGTDPPDLAILRGRRLAGRTAGLGNLAGFPHVCGGYGGDGAAVYTAILLVPPAYSPCLCFWCSWGWGPLGSPHQHHRHRPGVPQVGTHPGGAAMVRAGWDCAHRPGRSPRVWQPSVLIQGLHWYAPAVLEALFYLPALVGLLYGSAPHRGQRLGRKEREVSGSHRHQHDAVSRPADGAEYAGDDRLAGGGLFCQLFTPMLLVSSELSTGDRPIDYLYHYRSDQTMLTRQEVAQLAADHGVEITTWSQVSAATLGCDGIEEVETEGPFGTTYTEEYHGLLHSASFLSESAFRELTGIEVDLAPGTGANILDDQASTPFGAPLGTSPTSPTWSPVRRWTFSLWSLCGIPSCSSCFLLDDGDYAAITQGLTPRMEGKNLWHSRWQTWRPAIPCQRPVLCHRGPLRARGGGGLRLGPGGTDAAAAKRRGRTSMTQDIGGTGL